MGKKLVITCLLAFLAAAVCTKASNTITMGSASGSPGDTVTVTVTLNNTDNISAMQLQMPLPDNCSLVEGSASTCTRTQSHSVTAGVKDGILNLLVYSASMAEITGNSGDVMTFQLKLGNQPSTTTLVPAKVILTDTGGHVIEATAGSGTLTVASAKATYSAETIDFGRVPIRGIYTKELTINNVGNAPLTVTDLEFSAPEFTSATVLPLTIEAGSSHTITLQYAPVERGQVNQRLKVICNSSSRLNNIALKATPFAVNELHIDNVSGIADSTVDIHLRMNNMDAITGFQLEFAMPQQLKYVDGSFTLGNRKTDHQCVASLTNGILRVIAFSPTNKAFTGNEGELASFKVRLDGQYGTDLLPYKAILSATIDGVTQDVLSDKYSGYVNISSPVLSAPRSLNMGRTPVTQDATSLLSINNYGSAPLIISRIVFDTIQFSVKDSLPIIIPPNHNKKMTVVYQGQAQRDYRATMQLYCNDPNQRLWNVAVSGNRYAPNFLSLSTPNIYNGDSLQVNVFLDNYDPINGAQFDISYPKDYFQPTNTITATDRANGLSMQVRQLSDGICRYFVYSLSNASVAAGTGKIFTFTFSPKQDIPLGTYKLRATGIKLGTPGMQDKYAGDDIDVSFKVIEKVAQKVSWTEKNHSMVIGDSIPFKATSSASLPIAYSIVDGTDLVKATAMDGKFILKALKAGEVKLVAYSEGDSTHLAASDTCVVTIKKKQQSLSWTQETSVYVGSSLPLSAMASSGNKVIYEIRSGSEYGEIIADSTGSYLLHGTHPGEITLVARQSGDSIYEGAEMSKSFSILALEQQTLSWTQKADTMVIGDSIVVEAVSSATLPITYTITKGAELVRTSVADGRMSVVALGSGIVEVTAQSGSDYMHSAATSSFSFTIKKKQQSLSWSQETSVYVGSSLPLSATASSGNKVTYEIRSGSEYGEIIADSTGSYLLHGTHPGEITLVARQSGDSIYEGAEMSKSFSILALEQQTLSWTQKADTMVIGDSIVVEAVSSATLPITYTITKGAELVRTSVADGRMSVVALGSGIVEVTAQSGSDYMHSAATSSFSFTIKKKQQSLSWSQETSVYVGSSLPLSAMASSGLEVTYEITSGNTLAEITREGDGYIFKALQEGTVTIAAKQSGNETYDSVAISREFTILALNAQKVNWTQKADTMHVGDSFTFKATSSASLPIAYRVIQGTDLVESTAKDGQLIVKALKAGEVTITATAEGDATHKPSESVPYSFIIVKKDQSISWQQCDTIYEGSSVILNAVASSGLAVSYEIAEGCEQYGQLITSGSMSELRATGTAGNHIYVIARQDGNNAFNAAPPVGKEFVIVKKTTGINPVYVSDDDKGIAWYTLTGMKMPSRPTNPGLYIRVKDGRATKVIVK